LLVLVLVMRVVVLLLLPPLHVLHCSNAYHRFKPACVCAAVPPSAVPLERSPISFRPPKSRACLSTMVSAFARGISECRARARGKIAKFATNTDYLGSTCVVRLRLMWFLPLSMQLQLHCLDGTIRCHDSNRVHPGWVCICRHALTSLEDFEPLGGQC
jgi:hypothetical protein